jgi:hypothetical protein
LKDLAKLILLVALLVVIGVYVAGEASEKRGNAQAAIMYGRAHLVEVQNEARKDLLAGLMPYTVLGLGVVAGAVVVIVVSLGTFGLLFTWINHDGEVVIARRAK